MRLAVAFIVGAAVLAGCRGSASKDPKLPGLREIAAAEAVIDAFYTFDAARLRKTLMPAEASIPMMVFYQGWAKGGNYRVVNRMACKKDTTDEVSCSITAKDDLVAALGINFDVTDTFHFTFAGGRIAKVRTSSNDPPAFNEALEWVRRERPELFRVPCQGFFNGGPTPGECVRSMVRGFAEFARQQPIR